MKRSVEFTKVVALVLIIIIFVISMMLVPKIFGAGKNFLENVSEQKEPLKNLSKMIKDSIGKLI